MDITFFKYWSRFLFALSQSFGRVPQSTDFLKMFLKQGASSSAHVLRMMFGILSDPLALDELVFFSNFSTPSTVIFRFCIVEPARCGSTVVEIFGFGFLKTDLNCLKLQPSLYCRLQVHHIFYVALLLYFLGFLDFM